MGNTAFRRIGWFAAGFLGIWLLFQYILPIFLPFFLGLGLALAAEPAVKWGSRRLKLPRWAASGLGVTLTLTLLIALLSLLGAATVKELGVLAGKLPNLQETAEDATARIRLFLENAADRSPESVRPLLNRSVDGLFTSGSALLEQTAVSLPRALSGFLSRIPNSALGACTGLVSAFLLSSRLPRLKAFAWEKLPEGLKTKLLPALNRSKKALLGWLKAQAKLALITYCIVTLGLLLLGIPLAPVWAALIALVDAVPMLGTGTVLIPWAIISLFQSQHFRAIGLLCIFGACFCTRTVLEPRFVGRHLGLDPLVTLIFLYLGFRFWGLWGMLLAPMLAAAVAAVGKPAAEG